LPAAAKAAEDAARLRAGSAAELALLRAKNWVGINAAAGRADALSGLVPVPKKESATAAALRQLTAAIKDMTSQVASAIQIDLVNRLGEIDINGDSAVQLAELKTAFGDIASEATLVSVFRTLDTNGDGQISLLESIVVNTQGFARVLATNEALARLVQADADRFFASTQPGTSATLSNGTVVTNTGGGSASVTGASGSSTVAQGSSVVVAAATNPDLAAAWKAQYSQVPAVMQRIADDAQAWLQRTPTGVSVPWAGGTVTDMGDYGLWAGASGIVPIHINSWEDAAMLAARYPAVADQWRSEGYKFATGGAFTNGIVTRPTAFNTGLMGEAGPEAIMPLTNVNGSLGVRVTGGRDDGALIAELQALRSEVQALRSEARATAINTGRTQDLMKRVTRNGEAMQTEAST
jgi:hypothetical protein